MGISLTHSGMLICVTAPSGAGKTSICRALLAGDEGIALSVSTTTRPPREGEAEGDFYNFVDRERFEEMIEQDAFYEYAVVYDNYYGTRRDSVDALLAAGSDVLLEIDVQGSLSVKELCPEAVLIFILPPSIEALRERLERRGKDAAEVVERRMESARAEIALVPQYDYAVVNENLETAIRQVQAIIAVKRQPTARLEISGA
jgi:guanylate kinase